MPVRMDYRDRMKPISGIGGVRYVENGGAMVLGCRSAERSGCVGYGGK